MRFQGRNTLRLRNLHFHVPVFSIAGLILRVVAENVLIPQFDGNSELATLGRSLVSAAAKARPPVCFAISDSKRGPEISSAANPKGRLDSKTPIA